MYVSDKLFTLLFADDSNMFISGENPDTLIKTMNEEMLKVVKWLKVNKLSLNLKKTHFMVFKRRKRKVNLNESLVINDVQVPQVEQTKFLGIIIDQHILFDKHIQYVKGKISRSLGILQKCKRFFNELTLLNLYNALIYPYFNYCILIWGNSYQTYLDRLVKLQKWAVRTIVGANRYTPSKGIFDKLAILNLRQVYLSCVELFMYTFYHCLLPDVFSNFFTTNDSIHNYGTRNANKLHPGPLIHHHFAQNNIRITAVKIHNYFDSHLNWNCSYPVYKNSLKSFLVRNSVSDILYNGVPLLYYLFLCSVLHKCVINNSCV